MYSELRAFKVIYQLDEEQFHRTQIWIQKNKPKKKKIQFQ